MFSGPKSKLRHFEKLAYLFGVPVLMAAGGFTIYKKNIMEADERAERLRKVEEKFLSENPDNMIKL